MHTNDRNTECMTQRESDACTDEKRAGEPRADGHRDRVDVASVEPSRVKAVLDQRQDPSDVVARCKLRDDPTVFPVHVHLGMDRLREHGRVIAKKGDAGFVAGGFDAKNDHLI